MSDPVSKTTEDRHICDYPVCSVRGAGHPLACNCQSWIEPSTEVQKVSGAPKTTGGPLSAKAKRLVLKALSSHRINLNMGHYRTTDEDKIAELDMDLSYTDAVIREVESWEVKSQ